MLTVWLRRMQNMLKSNEVKNLIIVSITDPNEDLNYLTEKDKNYISKAYLDKKPYEEIFSVIKDEEYKKRLIDLFYYIDEKDDTENQTDSE